MATAIQKQFRRDTYTNLIAATPVAGEPAWDTTNKRLCMGDGSTLGGIRHTSAKDYQNQTFIYGTVGGTGDVITIVNLTVWAAYAAGQRYTLKAGAANTTAVTINIDGLGAKDVKKMKNGALAALAANDIISGGVYDLYYDGTQFQIKGLREERGVILSTTTYATNTTYSTTIPADDTIPQNTEGTEMFTIAYTPVNASSQLEIEYDIFGANASGNTKMIAALFVDTTADALYTAYRNCSNGGEPEALHGYYKVSAASTSSRTYKVRVGASSGNFFPNGTAAATRLFGGVSLCSFRVREILP